jgi:hypothetical protein
MSRREDLTHFYSLLDRLDECVGGKRLLGDCSGRMSWPKRGVYFFFENGEQRSDMGEGTRVVRVGTHALAQRSRTTLWNRLSQHQGIIRTGGGNHRGSIFRLIVGTALAARENVAIPSWGWGSTADRPIRDLEHAHEIRVSDAIRAMPFLWLPVDDDPGPNSLRGFIERNAIALLSNYDRAPLDLPSAHWLGRSCDRERVRSSGLWNQSHVEKHWAPNFLDVFARLIEGARL